MSLKSMKKRILPFAAACLAAGCAPGQDSPAEIPTPPSYSEEAPEPESQDPQQDLLALPAGSAIEQELSPEEINRLFYIQEISDGLYARIHGISYVENEDIALSDLRYLRLLHIGFDERTHVGELIVNESISDDILQIFRTLYDRRYPIEKMVLVDEYGGDDSASMLDNNTSAFNYRLVEGSNRLSQHAYGLAIDVNPFYNPYITYENGQTRISPEGSEPYSDRNAGYPYMIVKNDDLCWQLFNERGFTWGGDWRNVKDYQHFQRK